MRNLISRLAMVAASLALVLSFSVTSASALNLVTNGDFETGDLSGWTVNGSFIRVGTESYEGNFAARLGTMWELGSLSQSGIPTTPGTQYLVSFALANPGSPEGFVNQFDVLLNGTTLFSQQNPDSQTYAPYTEYTFDFIAASTQSEILFLERNDGQDMFALDAVSIAPVPEPSTLLLLGIGLLGASFLRKRVRNS